MRMLALPAALALSLALYAAFPKAKALWLGWMKRLYACLRERFGGSRAFLPVAALVPCAVCALFSALHPAVCALFMVPLFGAFAALPDAARTKEELDSGAYAKDIAAYEEIVRKTCEQLGAVFVGEACLPLLLCALGMALRLGGGLCFLALALRMAGVSGKADRMLGAAERVAARVMLALLRLFSCFVGRSPFLITGKDVPSRLLCALGISRGGGNHAPLAGDITQAAFLCCLCVFALCAALTLLVLPLA